MVVNIRNQENPMWIRWISLISKNAKLQRVYYMTLIELSPSRKDVVKESLIRS